MKRRIAEGGVLRKTSQHAPTSTQATKTVAVPAFSPQGYDLPKSLARWTGNLLYLVTNMGARYYAEVVAPLGLNPYQVAVLQVLADEGAMRQARLTDRTGIDKATMVGVLNDLERQKLIERHPSPTHKRAFDIYLTAQGNTQVQRVEQVSQHAEEQFYKVLSPLERQTLRALLLRLITQSAEETSE
jgi:DNA-binding MarR family transcriptional regulator